MTEIERLIRANRRWRDKAKRLFDLVEELAPHTPRTLSELYERATKELVDGYCWLDGQLIDEVEDE